MRSPISQASLCTKQPNCINQLPSPLELPPKLNLLSTHSRAQRKEASLLLDLLQNVRGRLVMAVSQKWGYIRIITGTILGGALGFYVMHRLETRHKEKMNERLKKYEAELKKKEKINELEESMAQAVRQEIKRACCVEAIPSD